MNQPRDRPILFSAPMVNAILDGRKTMTRRIVDASIEDHPEAWSAFTVESTEPKYRDTWSISKPDPNGRIFGTPTGTSSGRATELWRGKCPYGEPGDRLWVMETHADCMITLEVKGVRLERLQRISAADAIAEGIEAHDDDGVRPSSNPWVWVVEFARVK